MLRQSILPLKDFDSYNEVCNKNMIIVIADRSAMQFLHLQQNILQVA